MVAPDDHYEPQDAKVASPVAEQVSSDERMEAPARDTSLEPEKWRATLGRHVVSIQQGVDANLTLVRVGCILLMAGSAYAAVNLSGVLSRFNHVNDIPSYYFNQRKAMRVRMVRQSDQDPNVFYVYHTPFLRRVLLRDTLPKVMLSTSSEKPQPLIAVRAFGLQVDESAHEWIWSNVVSSHRYMTIRPMHRMNAEFEGQEPLATCAISIRKWPFDKDFAHELISLGLAECLPENVDKYADGRNDKGKQLVTRLKQLEAAQKHAQTMQYGIWKDWQDEKLTDRVLSASKRLSNRGFQKLVNKVTGSE